MLELSIDKKNKCFICNNYFTPHFSHPNQKYCSKDCRKKGIYKYISNYMKGDKGKKALKKYAQSEKGKLKIKEWKNANRKKRHPLTD